MLGEEKRGLMPQHCRSQNRAAPCPNTSQLGFSRDGLMWHRPERQACVEVGPLGSGCEGMVHCWRAGLVTLPDGQVCC